MNQKIIDGVIKMKSKYRKKRVYISGKMSGVPNFNKPKFDEAKGFLKSMGYEVVSPADNGVVDSFEWSDYMRVDIALLMYCDAIYMLDDHEESKGAAIELQVARSVGLDVMYQVDGGKG